MEKYEFIKLMLQNRNLSVNDKKRLLVLATREIEQNDNSEKKAFTEIANKTSNNGTWFVSKKTEKNQQTSKSDNSEIQIEIEEKEQGGNTVKGTYHPQMNKHRRGVGRKYISPSILSDFLARYRDDEILKNTCHLIDDDSEIEIIKSECHTDNYDLEQHSLLIEEKFSSLFENYKKDFPDITHSKMIPLIRAYLTGKDYNGEPAVWSSLKIQTNWQSKELLDWGKQNPDIIPIPGMNIASNQKNNGFALPKARWFQSNLSKEIIKDMKGVVFYFKGLFHIKRDNPLKKILINNLDKDNNGNYIHKIKIEDGNAIVHFCDTSFFENIELLTDVDKLLQAFNKIITICIKNQNKKQFGDTTRIDLTFYEEGNHTFFCIHHTNSRYGKTARNATEQIGQEQGLLITNQVNGLCDLFIEADFGGEQYYRINLWDDNPKMEYTKIEPMNGVKYILRF